MLRRSLEGRWVSVARVWADANVPCDVSKYFDEVTPVMPPHIRMGGTPMSKVTLAKQALRRLKLKVGEDGKLSLPAITRKAGLYDHEQVTKDREDNGRIDIHDIANKRRHAMSHYLLRRGWKRTSTPWVYERINNAD